MEADLHGAGLDVEHTGDLVVGEPGNVVQQDHPAVGLREVVHLVADARAHLGAFEVRLDARLDARGRRQLGIGGRVDAGRLPGAQGVNAQVVRDAKQPAQDLGRLAQSLRRSPAPG